MQVDFLSGHNSCSWTDGKPGAQSLFQVSHMGAGPKDFLKPQTGSWMESEAARTQTGAHMDSWHMQSEDLATELLHQAPQIVSYFTEIISKYNSSDVDNLDMLERGHHVFT